jgi:Rieske Fe-S protein
VYGSPDATVVQTDAGKHSATPDAGLEQHSTSRRAVIIGAGVAVVAGAAGFAWYTLDAPKPTAAGAGSTTPGTGGAPTELAAVTSIPENGGVILPDQKVVLTRETGDKVHCFTAVCTHQGCLVSAVADGKITCPCHGSAYDAKTGAVVGGPAPAPLSAVPVSVVNGAVYTG